MSGFRPPQAVAVTVMVVSAASVAAPGSALAAALSRPRVQLTFGLLTGLTSRDASLADYQWDVKPRAAWGTHLLAGIGRFEGGLRLWQASTTQSLDAASATSPTVRATSIEVVAHARVGTFMGTQFLAVASTGQLHLGYHPDRIDVDLGTGSPVTVDFAPIDEWIAGAGFALRRPLPGPWTVALEMDRRVFRLDTAHREGNAVVLGRESFGEWNAQLALDWQLRR